MKRIIISRTDSIGDSILTLPLCGYLKQLYPELHITYLGKAYTKDVVMCSKHIDAFEEFVEGKSVEHYASQLKALDADTIVHVFPRPELAKAAKQAGIQTRVGTSGRLYHLTTCNKRVKFSRKRSDLHESQLNFKLLKGLGINLSPSLDEVAAYYGVEQGSGAARPWRTS